MNKTYISNGAQWLITFQGNPSEVASEVNRFCNHGLFRGEAIPATYREGKDSKVIVAATHARLGNTLRSIAEAELRLTAADVATLSGRQTVRSLVTERAAELHSEFMRNESEKRADPKDAKEVRDYTLRDDEIAPWMRKAGKRILGAFHVNEQTSKKSAKPKAE